jgi:ABC-type Fe3+-siderophore transport system permease subunit
MTLEPFYIVSVIGVSENPACFSYALGVVAGGALGAVFGAAVFLVGSLFDVVFGTPPPPPQPPPPPPPPV